MRLLNTKSKMLENFVGAPLVYAILSHRWRDEEVTLGDLSKPNVASMKGYAKLSDACDMARHLGFDYLWMDTCCIDKTSSSELSEAINSMYMWYKRAGLCIAYLDDVKQDNWEKLLSFSTWFTRGWTLQELIAPAEVLFVVQNWEVIGTKTSLAARLTEITNIDARVLLTRNLNGISIATRMAWAAKRETTRVEDRAYSLMGIFDVNMPTIYGEGAKAFLRLQEELIRKSDDQSIFAWGELQQCCSSLSKVRTFPNGRPFRDYQVAPTGLLDDTIGLLAPDPSLFEEAVEDSDEHREEISVLPMERLERALGVKNLDAEYSPTNHGIRIRLPVQLIDSTRNIFVAFLGCGSTDKSSVFAIYLRLQSGNQFSRVPGFYNRPDLLRLSLSDVVKSNITSKEYLYVQAREPKTWPTHVTSYIDAQSVSDFCRQRKYTLLGGSAFPSVVEKLEYTLSDDTPEEYFILQNKATRSEVLVVTTQDGDLVKKYEKECILVRACTVGRNGTLAISPKDAPEDIYKQWQNAKKNVPSASHFAVVSLPGGQELTLTMVCVEEPDWRTYNEENNGYWKLNVGMLEKKGSTG